jgi:AmmeMemoRadiSam system protein B
MKRNHLLSYLAIILIISLLACKNKQTGIVMAEKIRPLMDTVGFAQYSWQMDSLMDRIDYSGWKSTGGKPWKMAICPHDDYTYVGKLYPELLHNVRAKTLILIGVAHRAAQLGIEDSLVFETYTHWKGPWKNVPVSPVREELFNILNKEWAIISDSLQRVEHSIEAMIPFLQYFNRNIEIVPILVPAMNPDRMQACGKALADAVKTVAVRHGWVWGRDYALVVTTDAVHYGNEEWGGVDRAYFGCDDKGNAMALEHESEIIRSCLEGKVTPENFKLFSSYTLKSDNYKEYKWTWCGRYSVPVALYTAYYLNRSKPLNGEFIGYSTSITEIHIPVDDLSMGRTAIATKCHWVGYAAMGYR